MYRSGNEDVWWVYAESVVGMKKVWWVHGAGQWERESIHNVLNKIQRRERWIRRVVPSSKSSTGGGAGGGVEMFVHSNCP